MKKAPTMATAPVTETQHEQWARLVKTRATGHLGKTNLGKCATALHRQIQKTLGEEATPNLPTVRGWLDGACVPTTPAIHTALMNALALPETEEVAFGDELTQAQKIHNSAAKARVTLTRIYDGLNAELKKSLAATDAPARRARAPRTISLNGTGSHHAPREQRHSGYYDSPYIPERVITSDDRYHEMSESRCKDIMKRTKNAHEYMACYIQAYGGGSFDAWENRNGLKPDHWCNGASLPSLNTLKALKTIMGEHYAAFDDLLIANRLAMAKGAMEHNTDGWGNASDNPIKAKQSILSDMPPRYWLSALEQLHLPDAALAENQPVWAQEIIPLMTKQDYLFATRHALEKSTDEVAKEIEFSSDFIKKIESGKCSIAVPTGQALVAFYTTQQQIIDTNNTQNQVNVQLTTPRLFDAVMFEKLPSSYDREQYNAYRRTTYANRTTAAQGAAAGRR